MKVVLLKDVKKLGKRGDVVEVADGYGRNVLIRQGLGVEGNKTTLNEAAQKKESQAFQSKVAADEAVIMASQLKKVKVVIKVQSGEDGKIFGSVTGKDICDAIKAQYGFELDKKNIKLKTPIKTTGEYDVEVWVHQQVTSDVHVSVVTE